MAGAAGFEPANAGIKTRCLTAWRRPIADHDHVAAFVSDRFSIYRVSGSALPWPANCSGSMRRTLPARNRKPSRLLSCVTVATSNPDAASCSFKSAMPLAGLCLRSGQNPASRPGQRPGIDLQPQSPISPGGKHPLGHHQAIDLEPVAVFDVPAVLLDHGGQS